jgi:dTDP-L-rhamnose 4-epimerase
MNILITGGAGFIGRYTARECLAAGHSVQILDSASPQIHGDRSWSAIADEVRSFVFGSTVADRGQLELVHGDVCDPDLLGRCLRGKDAVMHLAAETGTGQSMYEITRYERTNIGGTANLAERLADGACSQVHHVILASSRAVYGEGKYICPACGPVFPGSRALGDLQAGLFEPRCPCCRAELVFAPTPEDAFRSPCSFYGLTKSVQEDIFRMLLGGGERSLFVLRYQNVYGAGQSLSNPYTGIISIFFGLACAGKRLNIFEDGLESRDFVHVEDIARANVQCLTHAQPGGCTLNLGTGCPATVLDIANTLVELVGSKSPVQVSGQFRVGDIRHACGEIAAAQRVLGFAPHVGLRTGLERFVRWASGEETRAAGAYEQSLRELAQKGLLFTGKSKPA